MTVTRFSPHWHSGDVATFARVVGVTPASPISTDDPIHAERIERYERNILYYQKSQYHEDNRRLADSRNFLDMKINYTGICRRSVNMKANWLFGKAVGISAIPLDEDGNPTPESTHFASLPDPSTNGSAPKDSTQNPNSTLVKKLKDKINQVREINESDFNDWVMSVMGMVCGDYFVQVDALADDVFPNITVHDPAYCFPDYPDSPGKPMRAFQLQYVTQRTIRENNTVKTKDVETVEDWRLEVESTTSPDELEFLETLPDEQINELQRAAIKEEAPPEKLVCVYRKFEDGEYVPKSKRSIGIPAIPFIHGLNTPLWNNKYGQDEISDLIPAVEKYNETFHHAERIARTNAHATLALAGVRRDEFLPKDVDDVIFLGEKGSANVISLPSDVSVMKMITDTIERELHRDANIPVIAEGDSDQGFGSAPSGLSLRIKFGPLKDITEFHHLFYGRALASIYTLVLMFDEMVIDGKPYGSKWNYKAWKFKFDWYNAMPVAESEVLTDMKGVTDPTMALLSHRTAREKIPGIDPDQEEIRISEQNATRDQQQIPGGGTSSFDGGLDALSPAVPDDQLELDVGS